MFAVGTGDNGAFILYASILMIIDGDDGTTRKREALVSIGIKDCYIHVIARGNRSFEMKLGKIARMIISTIIRTIVF